MILKVIGKLLVYKRSISLCFRDAKSIVSLQGLPIYLKQDVKDAAVQRLGIIQLQKGEISCLSLQKRCTCESK